MVSPVGRIVDRVDDAFGAALEAAVRRHHRRRMARTGHRTILDLGRQDPTGDGACLSPPAPPRAGNTVDVLIDGEDALAAMADSLQAARSHIHIAGWHLSPDLRLQRTPGAPTLVDLLAGIAGRMPVRVLLWAGPPVPVFRPSRPMMRAVRDRLNAEKGIECVLDARERTLHCHHEKVVVIDDEIAFVGGIDLSDLTADRWDRSAHPPRNPSGWHDVATRLTGPVVTDVAEHFRSRWQEAAHEHLPPPAPQGPTGEVKAQLIRTIPERVYRFSPQGEFGILDAYLRALHSAGGLVYLENQFLWSTEVVQILLDKLRNPPNPRFRVLLVLPARPHSGADTTRGQLGALIEADAGTGHLLACTVRACDDGRTAPLYVHAKVGIIDDSWLTIGSANLNEHSLFNDTEVNVVTQDPALARTTRLRLWAEHLQRPINAIAGHPTEVIDTMWKPLAAEQAQLTSDGSPATHRLTRLPAVSRRTERLLGPVRGLLVDG